MRVSYNSFTMYKNQMIIEIRIHSRKFHSQISLEICIWNMIVVMHFWQKLDYFGDYIVKFNNNNNMWKKIKGNRKLFGICCLSRYWCLLLTTHSVAANRNTHTKCFESTGKWVCVWTSHLHKSTLLTYNSYFSNLKTNHIFAIIFKSNIKFVIHIAEVCQT